MLWECKNNIMILHILLLKVHAKFARSNNDPAKTNSFALKADLYLGKRDNRDFEPQLITSLTRFAGLTTDKWLHKPITKEKADEQNINKPAIVRTTQGTNTITASII